LPKGSHAFSLDVDEDNEKRWGLGLDDLEHIIAKQLTAEPEVGACVVCTKRIFRVIDYSGRTPIWSHSSSGQPISYSPQLHEARSGGSEVEPHDHSWKDNGEFLACTYVVCGARRMRQMPKLERGVFMPSIKDQQMAEARARGAAKGSRSQTRTHKAKEEQSVDG
jgi:hypothetical protein